MRIHRTAVGLLGRLLAAALSLALASAALADIHAAVRAGDVGGVQAALQGGTDVNATDSWGRTPLVVALQQGKAPVVEFLLNSGASVTATDAWGRTPLLVATQMRNTAAVRLLLERRSDVNAANRNDITPLIAAAQTGNHEAATLLLAAGAATDRADNLGWTPLMWAMYRKDDAMSQLLRERGAVATTPQIAASRPPTPPGAVAEPALSPAIDPERIVRGNPRAQLTIFEYTDFQCPYCARGATTIDEVMARYEGQVRLIVKHLPLPLLHPMAMACALHFEAIAMQSPQRAWAFYDRLFRDQRALGGGEAYLRATAADLGVDLQRLEQSLRDPATRARVSADLAESERFQFDGVPAFIVDGQAIRGAQPPEAFFKVIDAALRRERP